MYHDIVISVILPHALFVALSSSLVAPFEKILTSKVMMDGERCQFNI